MTNLKTSPLLSPQTGGQSSGKRRSISSLFDKIRSKSPNPSSAAKVATTATLAPISVQENINASRSSPNMSIATACPGASTVQVALSSGSASDLATDASANLSTLSVNAPSVVITTATTPMGRDRTSTGPASIAPKGKGAATLTPRVDIFPKNGIARVSIDISAPKIGHDFESTAQLTICAAIFNDVFQKVSFSSSPASYQPKSITNHPTYWSLSVSQQQWIVEMEKNPIERHYVYQIMDRMVKQFVSDGLKDTESIREIVLLGSVLEKKSYKTLLDCFRRRLEGSTFFDIDNLLGLVQLIEVAPKGYLVEDDLNLILLCLRGRIELSSQLDKNVLAHFVLAIAMVLILLVAWDTTGLSREKEHEPLFRLLLKLRKNEDPLVKYQADYACQSLVLVPNDETSRQEFCRHLVGLSNGLLKMSGIARLEFNGIAEGLPDTIKGARGMFGFLRKKLGSGGKASWFSAIRMAEGHVQKGDFSCLKDMVYDPNRSQDPKFSWGITQLLGEIAADPAWDVASREQAVELLGELFKSRVRSKQNDDQDTPRWILTVLGHLSDLSTSDSNDAANSVLTISHAPIKAKAHALFASLNQSSGNEFDYVHPLRISLPLPKSSMLLKEANDNPDLDHAIYKHQHERQSEYKSQPPIFIPPMSKVSLVATEENIVALHTRTQEFLDGSAQVMLILGDSGAGKSTFNRHLENKLWEEYKPKEGCIPLFINLPEINHPQQDLIDKQLRIYKFSESHIKELKTHRRLLLICDGYDEARLNDNLHHTNFFDKAKHLDVKMMVSCRSTFVDKNHSDLFSPRTRDRYQATKSDQYTEAVIIPFSEDQIEAYVLQFVRDSEVHRLAGEEPLWSTGDYMDKLRSVPKLLDLVKNPFLLSLSLRAMPRVVGREVDLTKVKVTRLTLYDSFIDDWVDKSRLRLREPSGEIDPAFELLLKYGFGESVIDFSKNLAAAIYHQHNGNPVVEYRPRRNQTTWKCEFFYPDPEKTLLLASSPLSRVHDQYRFIHQSLLEYFYSRYVFEKGAGNDAPSQDPEDISCHPLSKRHLVKESSIIQFLAEYVQAHPSFKAQLAQIIMRSKTDAQASQAAANAVTILVRAGTRFHGVDLKGIRVPGADLSYGQFDCAQLQGADLRNATLRHIWLRHADLSGAQMEGVEFGELPYLQRDKEIHCSAYSLDGKALAIGLQDGEVAVYNTSTWAETIVLKVHTQDVICIAYSPSGHEIANGSYYDETVRLWDVRTGAAGLVLTGHADWVKSVAYSPSGHQIASGSHDKTVRLWDARTGTVDHVLTGHTGYVISVAYSPAGHQIASCSEDSTVRLWDAQTGAACHVLNGTKWINSVAYSPTGHQIASGSDDKTVRLWDSQTGAAGHVLTGHTGYVNSVAYSPTGHQIASCSEDKTVRLWDAQTGAAGLVLTGHTKWINSIAYSPSGHQIASGSHDNTVRLWDAQTGVVGLAMESHTQIVTSVTCSLGGHQIASGSRDMTVRIWDAQTGAAGHVLTGHTSYVNSVACSPIGHQIASGSNDKTVRLWDAQTGAAGLVLTGHTDSVKSVTYSPSGHQIASGSYDKTMRLWDAQNGAACHVLTGHTDPVKSVAYSPSGHQIVSGSDDKTVRLWNAHTGAAGHVLTGHTSYVNSVTYSPAGHQIASGSSDKTVRLWDAQTGSTCHVLTGHSDPVKSVAYSPSGHQIATGSEDNTVQLWDKDTGRCLAVVRDPPGAVFSLSWRSDDDGSYFTTGCDSGSVSMWEVSENIDDIQVRLVWNSAQNSLVLSRASIGGVLGLSESNIRLLQQRGAVRATI